MWPGGVTTAPTNLLSGLSSGEMSFYIAGG